MGGDAAWKDPKVHREDDHDHVRDRDRGVDGRGVSCLDAHPKGVRCCCQARCRIQIRRKSQRTIHQRTRRQREVCGRCSTLWKTSSPCPRCRRHLQPIECDVAQLVQRAGAACPRGRIGVEQVVDVSGEWWW